MKKIKFNISTLLYGLVLVLFCLTASTSLMSLRYMARFTTNSGGGDGSRVAAYVVDFTRGNDIEINTDAYMENGSYAQYTNQDNYEGTYDFAIKNQNALGKVCEVSVRYKIDITVPAIPSGYTEKLKNEWQTVLDTMKLYAVSGSTRTQVPLTLTEGVYTTGWLTGFNPGVATTKNYELSFNAYTYDYGDGSYVNVDMLENITLDGFTIKVSTEQID